MISPPLAQRLVRCVLLGAFVVSSLPSASAGAPAGAEPTLEQRARALENQLIAPCCWRQPLSNHDSEAAGQMKASIRVDLAAGRTEEEILAAYESRYGIQILAEPPKRGFHNVAHWLPLAAFLAGLATLSIVLARWIARGEHRRQPPPPVSSNQRDRIERELSAL